MEYRFNCYGHQNILANHRSTLEFTKEPGATKAGDCIIGVKADFALEELIEFVGNSGSKRIFGEVFVGKITDSFSFIANNLFSDGHEMVIRKGDFSSSRTLGIFADKAAIDLKKELRDKLKEDNIKIEVIFSLKDESKKPKQ
jgi:uncharacterized protein